MAAPLRRWRSRYLQFSLRTLMIVTLLVAVACAWYLQPPSREETLAGGKLKLWRQVKFVAADASPAGGVVPPPEPVNHGRWTLSTRTGTVLCTGYYRDGEKVGRWITYFPDGTKATEGVLERDVRIGTWHTWYASGQMETETTYQVPVDERNLVAGRPLATTGTTTYGYSFSYGSIRSGPARAWYANGNLRYEGTFADDCEEGLWKYYDEQRKLVSQGSFRAGLRDGVWTFTDAAGKSRREIYVDGRTEAELTQLLALLERKLHRRGESNRRAIAESLESLGSPAATIFIAALDSDLLETRIEAARSLARLEASPAAALPKLRTAAKSADEHERLYATVAIYAIDEASRDRLFGSLWGEVLSLDTSSALDIAEIMYRADTARHAEIFSRLMELKLADEPLVSRQVTSLIARLPGDNFPYLTAQARSANPHIRERVANVLQWMRTSMQYRHSPQAFSRTQALVDLLKRDSDVGVRSAAENADTLPGTGGFGGSGGGFF